MSSVACRGRSGRVTRVRRARASSTRNWDAAVTWLFVALLHAIAAWILVRPVVIDRGDGGLPLQVVFIQRLHARPQPVANRDQAVAPDSSAKPATHRARLQARAEQAVSSSSPAWVVGDDAWDRAGTGPADGIVFAHQPLASSFNPRPRPAPGRFRMRRQLSPEDVVRGVSQVLGFWPPGYTDDPCAGLDKAVEMFTQGRTAREQDLLVDAFREREKYCK